MTTRSLAQVEVEILVLQDQLAQLKVEASSLRLGGRLPRALETGLPMELEEYRRYGRQMIMPGVGLPGQLKLRESSVLVIGAGGLGCPALQYLAAAGVGHIAVVDHDRVELSNLHRQILHTEDSVGMLKVESAKIALSRMNSSIKVTTHPIAFTPSTALSLVSSHDLVLDCTDKPLTRYLISDACVIAGKPLVSGAALGFNGQLAVYNFGEHGPCYRCVWPRVAQGKARAATCEEEGVLGGVTGTIGTLMALEAVKILAGLTDPSQFTPTLLVYSATTSPPFRSIKLRKRQPRCRTCGNPSLPAPSSSASVEETKILNLEDEDYQTFCGGPDVDWVAAGLGEGEGGLKRVSVKDLAEAQRAGPGLVRIIDVRSPEEFSIASVPGSENVPLQALLSSPADHLDGRGSSRATYVICRRGNDSQDAVLALVSAAAKSSDSPLPLIADVRGGLVAWGRDVANGEGGGWPSY